MTNADRCPDCHHYWHSRRCFYVDVERGHLGHCTCPGSPTLMQQGRRLEQAAKEYGDEARRLLTFEGVKEFFGR